MRQRRSIVVALIVGTLLPVSAFTAEADEAARLAKAAVIPCKGMIDQGLLDSIERRSETAMQAGADYLIYEIETYGGLVDASDSIAKYFIQTIGSRARTVAYVQTEAISAGALISVSCNDVIMRQNTTIGDCAPISMGGKLEGVEREKAESFIRAAFQRAAEANGYPEALLKAMVTMQVEVWRIRDLDTGQWEFYERRDLPSDADRYDVDGAEQIVGSDELLTLTASQALEYGVARAVVGGLDEALAFLEEREGVRFARPPMRLETTWSEEMVRWLNSPAVMGVLVMLALLGVYLELSTPGVGLPGLVAVICFAVIIGSKYLTGLANWVEIVLFFAGVILLLVELFVLPGFGVAGILGILLILGGLFGMLVKNAPGELPWPEGPEDWTVLTNGVLGMLYGFVGFLVLASVLSRYLPKLRFMSGLILMPTPALPDGTAAAASVDSSRYSIRVGDVGMAISDLRPVGKARFGDSMVDVVATAEFLDRGMAVEIIEIHGNRVVVKGRDSA